MGESINPMTTKSECKYDCKRGVTTDGVILSASEGPYQFPDSDTGSTETSGQ